MLFYAKELQEDIIKLLWRRQGPPLSIFLSVPQLWLNPVIYISSKQQMNSSSLCVTFTDWARLVEVFFGLFEQSAPISNQAAASLLRKEEYGGIGDAGFLLSWQKPDRCGKVPTEPTSMCKQNVDVSNRICSKWDARPNFPLAPPCHYWRRWVSSASLPGSTSAPLDLLKLITALFFSLTPSSSNPLALIISPLASTLFELKTKSP